MIAGAAGNDVAAVDRAIARLPPRVAERVVRTGVVDDATKRWLLTHARALAYPSLDEGFGFPILEAQQAGTPVVASTAGSIPQIAGAAALLSPARDAEALAANLYWIVTNDEMHAKLVRRGHANVAASRGRRPPSSTTRCTRSSSPMHEHRHRCPSRRPAASARHGSSGA